jgi:hypothetical protein
LWALPDVVTAWSGEIDSRAEEAVVPRLRDFLQRFRPAGAPGAAAAAVPADRRTELAAELEPIFARFSAFEEERGRLLAAAADAADRLRAAGREQAAALVADARGRSAAERAAAAAQVRSAGAAGDAALVAEARAEAEAVRQRAVARLPVLVDDAVGSVRALAGKDER